MVLLLLIVLAWFVVSVPLALAFGQVLRAGAPSRVLATEYTLAS